MIARAISPVRVAALASRAGGALALIAAGVEHQQQYTVDHYSVVPTIGTLFLVNFVAASVIGVALLMPLEVVLRRRGEALLAALAASGIAVAAGSIAALVISERWGLFGFREAGYRGAIVTTLVLEVAAAVLLGAYLAARPRRTG